MERTISQTEHLFVVRAHANRQRGVSLLNRRLRMQKDSLAEMQEDILNVSEDLAEKEWCLRKAEEDVGSLQVELAAAHDVAKELAESYKRLQERAETAERRLMQATKGELDEELKWLRQRLDEANRELEDTKDLLSKATDLVGVQRERAQRAEAELSTVKMQHAKDHAAMCGYREANAEMGRKMEADAARIASLEAEIKTSEAEFEALKGAPDAVA